MLVLTRKRGENVVIRVGDQVIVVTALKAEHGTCKIGITANPEVHVFRQEIDRKLHPEAYPGA